jgi:cytochrome c
MRRQAIVAAVALAGLAACEREVATEPRLPGASPQSGRALVVALECGVCHAIPGVRGARGVVGPPLDHFGDRPFIAGLVPNRPALLVQWIMDPPSIAPATGMPSLGLTEAQARDVAAYLYTLR